MQAGGDKRGEMNHYSVIQPAHGLDIADLPELAVVRLERCWPVVELHRIEAAASLPTAEQLAEIKSNRKILFEART